MNKTEQLRKLLAERDKNVGAYILLLDNAPAILAVMEAVEQALPDCDPLFGSTERLEEAYAKWNGGGDDTLELLP